MGRSHFLKSNKNKQISYFKTKDVRLIKVVNDNAIDIFGVLMRRV